MYYVKTMDPLYRIKTFCSGPREIRVLLDLIRVRTQNFRDNLPKEDRLFNEFADKVTEEEMDSRTYVFKITNKEAVKDILKVSQTMRAPIVNKKGTRVTKSNKKQTEAL